MTRDEIANELFLAGKEIKQCFFNEIALSRTGNTDITSVYPQYLQLLKNLNIMYHSLNIQTVDFDLQINRLENSLSHLTVCEIEDSFISEYTSILNEMLLNTIKFRNKYSLIRRNDPVPGLASHIITNLGQIVASLNNGYIPLIDTVNANNVFTSLSRKYDMNAWELYFEQPFGTSYTDLVPGQEIKIADGIPIFMPTYNMDCLLNHNLIEFWRSIMRKYMPVSIDMTNRINSLLTKLPFHSGAKILGVLCRGTDYTNIRPYNHPVQPSLNLVLAKADEMMSKHQCDYCYLATEDQEILNAFRSKFRDKLLITQDIYYASDIAESINQTNIDCQVDLHRKNVEYLAALILLSKCRYFIGGRTSGTVVSLLLADHFDETYIWNCGRYGIDDSTALNSHIY